MRAPLRILLMIGLPALLLLGCGAQEGGEDVRTQPSESGDRIAIVETEFALEPKEVQVDRAGPVTVVVQNAGSTVHALAIEGPGGRFETERIEVGQSATLAAALSKEGDYVWYCPVADHRDRGMEGKVTVGAGGGGSGDAEDDGGGSGGAPGY